MSVLDSIEGASSGCWYFPSRDSETEESKLRSSLQQLTCSEKDPLSCYKEISLVSNAKAVSEIFFVAKNNPYDLTAIWQERLQQIGKSVTELDLTGALDVHASGLVYLLLFFPNLKKLQISFTEVHDIHFLKIGKFKELVELSFSRCHFIASYGVRNLQTGNIKKVSIINSKGITSELLERLRSLPSKIQCDLSHSVKGQAYLSTIALKE